MALKSPALLVPSVWALVWLKDGALFCSLVWDLLVLCFNYDDVCILFFCEFDELVPVWFTAFWFPVLVVAIEIWDYAIASASIRQYGFLRLSSTIVLTLD